MENIWLLEPVLEAFKNIAACRSKESQIRECVLFAILVTVSAGISSINFIASCYILLWVLATFCVSDDRNGSLA